MNRSLLILSLALSASCVAVAERIDFPTFESGASEHTRARTEPVAEYDVEDLAFLAGLWQGECNFGPCEEMWSEPFHGEMVGTFRLISEMPDGNYAPNFYEFLTLVKEDGVVKMKLKHFSPGNLKPWEEPEETTDFQLVEVTDSMASFGGLTIHKHGDHLTIFVAMSGDSDTDELLFRFERVDR